MSSTSISGRPPVPPKPKFVWFCHPFNKEIFLTLPMNNVLPGTLNIFGVHHTIALTACQIIACNELGFLSTSADRDDINAKTPPEDIFLTSKAYYYHPVMPSDGLNYRICIKFSLWMFPHGHLPLSWDQPTPIDDAGVEGHNMTDMSIKIKQRDVKCRVSGWFDNKSTAHIVPKEERKWMLTNRMDVYANTAEGDSIHLDSRNLFALRWDIHSSQFDSGNLVIVPMDGIMITHFISASHESAARYHNKPFDFSNLSHEFLFARFAWAIIKRAYTTYTSNYAVTQRTFRLKAAPLDGDDGDDDGDEDGDGDDGDDGDGDKPIKLQQQSDVKKKGTKRKRSDRPESKDPATRDARDLEQDLTKAKKVAPFFLDPEGIANRYAYENMRWYPGYKIVERKKAEYFDAHPNIRAYNGPCASPDTDSEGNID